MTEPSTRSSAVIELLSFGLGNDEYCIDIMSVREIRGWTSPTPMPHTPAHMRGVINLRGTVLPVIDLSMRFGMDPVAGDARNVIIVVSQGSQLSGLLVHSVSDILTLDRTALQPPPDVGTYAEEKFIEGLAIVDDRMIRLLNLSAVLPLSSMETT